MFLLDTNVVSELRKVNTGRADVHVARWQAAQSPEVLFLSAVTILELERGLLSLERKDRAQGDILRRWIEGQVLRVFVDRILSFDAAVARRCAARHVTDPRPDRDAMIAATALVHGLTLVTRNERDFAGTGIAILNPWRAQS